ncbi:Ig-like domain-containing protein [Pseudooctadecabacter jejudonensis]|uniref:Bifunctional hemolysin/adenylate cyclase n=1 Tax=Pseudooctadecabacter jejudonensis TaxID=1391910 RepID=A0A1Y5RHS6_9RHOB|nr:Ig-like domain-containing protein [Pseudooctadecabacter jejudonensis]SLN16617.1 Bifunctional hemolysin/adenylate cyclase precursor [Pseudooctadecabacter jejudonensis]
MSDYKIDWSNTNIDGANSANGPDGSVGFTVSTPENVDHDQWMKGSVNGVDGLKAWDVDDPTKVTINFNEPVTNVSFDLLDVDSEEHVFDDRITVVAKDIHGNILPVTFTGLNHTQFANNGQLDATDNPIEQGDAGSVVGVTIHGEVASLEIILDNGSGAAHSGTVGLGDIHFDAVADDPALDGYVEGTDGNDVIDVNYDGDPDGDRINANDAILPGEQGQDDVVLAGAGDDVVRSGSGNDEVFGGSGNDMLFSGGGDDVVFGGSGNDKVEASAGDDVVFGGFGNDDIWGGKNNDVLSGSLGADSIDGGDGDDTLSGGKSNDQLNGGSGNDLVFGGAGSDSITGGEGNDTLIGGSQSFHGTQDFNDLSAGDLIEGQFVADGVSITSADPTTPVMVFDSSNPTGDDNDLATGNLGNVLILSEDRDATDPDDNANGGTFLINFENPAYVSSLTLLDVEAGATVNYYDSHGNFLQSVNVTTADNGQHVVHSNINYVGQIEVILNGSGAIDNLSYSINEDVFDGGDVIDGGAGDDVIEGNDGNDVLTGGAGDDEIFGGDDADRIFGGAGDVVDGGAGGNDHDILDLTGEGPFVLEDVTPDSNGNGINGTVVFVDGDGNPTGETLTFTEIEEIRGDEVNRGPDAKDDTATTDEDTPVEITVLGNDSDPEGDPLTVTEATSPDGDVVINDDGTITFTPDDDFNGDTTITYTIDDGNGGTDTATVTVTVNPVNDAPIARDDTAETDEDTPVEITVLGNDSDPDGDPLTVTEATSPDGDVVINDDGTITFTPDDGFNGPTTITYTIDDGNGGTDTATVDVTVNGVNDDPIVCPDLYFVTEDEGAGDVDGNVITNPSDNNAGLDTDPDGDTLTVVAINGDDTLVGSSVEGSNGGLFTLNPDGSFDFTANGEFEELAPGETADTVITYTVSDGNGGTGTATLTITVQGINDAPNAEDSAYVVDQDEAFGDLDANAITDDTGNGADSDPEGDDLTVVSVDGVDGNVGQPVAGDNGGQFVINADGSVDFSADGDFDDLGEGETASTSVTYTIADEDGLEDTATVTFTVTGSNDGPVAVEDTFDAGEDDPAAELGNVLDNDDDPDGDDLSVSEVNGDPANVGEPVPGDQGGLVTINPDGTITFDPNGDFEELGEGETATTTVTYTVTDGNGGEDTETVTVTITGTNDAPVAVLDEDATDQDTAIVLDNVLGNDEDPENDPLTVSEVNGAPLNVGEPVEGDNGGTFVINADGTATFNPDGDFDDLADGETEQTTVTYTITDEDGATDTTTVTVTVTGGNDGPVAVEDTGETDQDTVLDLDNVLGNDSDPDGDDLTVADVNGDPANVGEPVAGDNGGLITINEDGTASFDPNGDFDDLGEGETAETTVTYTVTDGNGGEDTTTVTVTVTGTNDAPEATNNTYVVTQDEAFGDEDGNAITEDTGDGVDSDPEGDDLTVVSVDGVDGNVGQPVAGDNGGQFVINADGSVDFSADGDFDDLGEGETASTSVTYTIADEDGLEDTATVTFTVTGSNDGPVAVEDTFDAGEDDPAAELGNVLDNDDDPDGDDLTVAAVNGDPANVGEPVPGDQGGLVTINPDGTITFDPNGDFEELSPGETSETTVTYTVTDPSGETSTTTVTITVTGENDGPDATDNAYTVTLTEDAGDVDGNVITDDTGDGVDSDPEDDDLTVVAVDGDPANVGEPVAGDNGGLFTINPDGTVDFDANGDFDDLGLNDTDTTSITYTIVDENGAEDTATVTFTVTGINDGTVQGTAGDDIINPDIPYVDADGDIVDAGDGILPGDEGTDNDLILGFEGDDTIQAGEGDDVVFGGADDDSITGNAGDDDLSGDEGNDIIRGGTDDDTLAGGDGMDMLFGGANDDTLDGGDGDDKIEGGSGDDTLIGGLGNDDLWGASGDDSVDGGEGDDTIATAEGNDIVEGGDGDDIIDTANDEPPFENPFSPENLPDVGYPGLYPADTDPNDDLDTVFGGAGNDSIVTGDDDDTIFGGSGDDTIDAGFDDDSVEGGSGDDTIIGSEGNDVIIGEEGNDLIFGGLANGQGGFANLPDDLDGDGDSNDPGEDLVTDNNNDTLFGGAGNDTIFGEDDDDTLFGGTGQDTLFGGVDDDVINGDEGEDVITGGQGADSQFGGLGDDLFIVDEPGEGAGDVIVGGEDPDLDGDGESDDVDVLDLTGSNVDFITYVDGDPEAGTVTFQDGSTLTFSEIENVIPCFTPGTTIATPKGERLVEELREGDRIITRDNGIQEIRWVGRKEMSGTQLVQNPHLKPILIKAGALGNGLPERDMLVSPNHRCLVASEKTQLYFEEREVLAAAKHLVGAEGIHEVDVMGTAYIHFMFDRHEVVLSNGAWTESFQPGDYSLKGIGNSQRNEIFELFPELATKTGLGNYQSARRALKKHEARLLVK